MKPAQPSFKTPEQLAAEFEERVRQDAERQRRWRRRREWYRAITIATGALLPTSIQAFFGVLSSTGIAAYIDHLPWPALLTTASGGAAIAAVVFALGWGVIRGMIGFGVLFAIAVVVFRSHLGVPIAAMPFLACFYVVAGAAVGYLVVMEDEE